MTISKNQVWSDLPISPGSVLEEEIEARAMTQKELARRMGRPPQVVNEIIKAKKSITPETALALEKVLGIPAQVWVNLESVYRMTKAKNDERERLQQEASALSRFPVKEMAKHGWIPANRQREDKVRALLEFLGVASLQEPWSQTVAAFRITGGGNYSPDALGVWLKKGEIDARKMSTADYDEARFRAAMDEIRDMTTETPDAFLPRMIELCAGAGVAFVLTKELPKSGANGAARRLGPHKRLIQLSLKWKWADVFWFTFFHEAGHILLHGTRSFVDVTEIGSSGTPEEDQANRFAADFLVNEKDWDAFIREQDWTEPSVRRFAENVGVHPGIVAGRLHHEKLAPYNRLTALKDRFAWVEE